MFGQTRLAREADGIGRVAVIAALAMAAGTIVAGCATQEAATGDLSTPVVEQANANAPVEQAPATAAVPSQQGSITQGGAQAVTVGDAGAGAMAFVVVPDQSEVSYLAKEEFFSGAVERLGKSLGLFDPVGTANGIEGNIDVVLEGAPTVTGGKLIVDLRGLTSDDERRDRRIREEWLQSDSYPEAVFVITGAEGMPASYAEGEEIQFRLLGDLTVRGVTKPAAWDVVATIENGTLNGTAETQILMSDFGVQPPNMANMFKVDDNLTVSANLFATTTPTEG